MQIEKYTKDNQRCTSVQNRKNIIKSPFLTLTEVEKADYKASITKKSINILTSKKLKRLILFIPNF